MIKIFSRIQFSDVPIDIGRHAFIDERSCDFGLGIGVKLVSNKDHTALLFEYKTQFDHVLNTRRMHNLALCTGDIK